jgi:hypothetical protein
LKVHTNKVGEESEQLVDRNVNVQDVLATMLAMLGLFKTLTNFILREFEM